MSKAPDPTGVSSPSLGDESFVGRWSRRKRAEPEKREDEDARVATRVEQQRVAGEAVRGPLPAAPSTAPADLPAIDSLTAESDYSRFMKADVPLASRNAAMKKLFTDPHFNVMDGLDIYIDDYTKADPIPESMLRGLAQSRMLKLFNYDKEDAEDAAELVRLRAERAAAEGQAAGTAVAAPSPDAVTLQHELEPIPASTLRAESVFIEDISAESLSAQNVPAENHSAVNLPAANPSAKPAT